jgi:GNAT superfamily N-acetyltransferase
MTLTWTKEASPRWDADKQRLFGPAELAAVGMAPPAPGEPVADEWWRVTDGGDVAGYGWLDTGWGDARITFFVAPGQRGRGVGHFILERLEAEAAARGLNYIYNVVPETHPDGPWIKNWLSMHGFREASRGQLRRQTGSLRRSGVRAPRTVRPDKNAVRRPVPDRAARCEPCRRRTRGLGRDRGRATAPARHG